MKNIYLAFLTISILSTFKVWASGPQKEKVYLCGLENKVIVKEDLPGCKKLFLDDASCKEGYEIVKFTVVIAPNSIDENSSAYFESVTGDKLTFSITERLHFTKGPTYLIFTEIKIRNSKNGTKEINGPTYIISDQQDSTLKVGLSQKKDIYVEKGFIKKSKNLEMISKMADDANLKVKSFDFVLVPKSWIELRKICDTCQGKTDHDLPYFETVFGNMIPGRIEKHIKKLETGDRVYIQNVHFEGREDITYPGPMYIIK